MRPVKLSRTLAIAATLLTLAMPAVAYDAPVEKRPFTLADFRFQDGRQLPLTLGYETYGKLNAARDNAILVCHYFGGTSHAAGQYPNDDRRPGYWDALIGAKGAIDTDRFFVVSMDIPANINIDPQVISTGPRTVDPKTGKPYGGRFPSVGIRDMVEAQRRLMDHLGIRRWHAVMGTSLGGMQAMQWAVSHPDRVARVMTAAAPGRSDAYNQAMSQVMIDAIRADKNYRGGDYYGQEPPNQGLAAAWKLMYAQILNRDVLQAQFPGAVGEPAPPFVVELETQAARRVGRIDANAWVAIAEASRNFDLAAGHPSYEAALARVKARTLVIAAEGDELFPPVRLEQDLVEPLRKAGKPVEYRVLATRQGHLGAVFELGKEGETIRAFLE